MFNIKDSYLILSFTSKLKKIVIYTPVLFIINILVNVNLRNYLYWLLITNFSLIF